MIAHCPADDLSAVEIQDRGQIEPALIGFLVWPDGMDYRRSSCLAGAGK